MVSTSLGGSSVHAKGVPVRSLNCLPQFCSGNVGCMACWGLAVAYGFLRRGTGILLRSAICACEAFRQLAV